MEFGGVSQILLEFTEEHSDNPTYLFERNSETENLVKWLWKTNHPDAIQILILGVIGKKKHLEYLSKSLSKTSRCGSCRLCYFAGNT
ncbi:putative molybdate metabolism protein [Escherichia coli]|nr:putative molybdate metabolism protein [Escherichia coli]